jgi:hypothetical protein
MTGNEIGFNHKGTKGKAAKNPVLLRALRKLETPDVVSYNYWCGDAAVSSYPDGIVWTTQTMDANNLLLSIGR